mgnify:CR=1 FL=1
MKNLEVECDKLKQNIVDLMDVTAVLRDVIRGLMGEKSGFTSLKNFCPLPEKSMRVYLMIQEGFERHEIKAKEITLHYILTYFLHGFARYEVESALFNLEEAGLIDIRQSGEMTYLSLRDDFRLITDKKNFL